MKDDEIMHQLKEILVGDEKKQQELFETELKKIEQTLYNHDELKTTIDPIIDERFEDLRGQFKQFFGQQVQQQIKDSEEELIQTLTPIMGKLIKKWIALEFIGLKENVNEHIKSSISIPERIFGRIKAAIIPEITTAKILSEAFNTAQVLDIFIIQQKTGFMMAKYSDEEMMNRNQTAGMMTALIDFGEEALKIGTREEIEQIKYELYTIHKINEQDYYAVILLDNGIQSKPKYVEPVKDAVALFIKEEIIPKNFSDQVDVDALSNQLREFLRKAAIC